MLASVSCSACGSFTATRRWRRRYQAFQTSPMAPMPSHSPQLEVADAATRRVTAAQDCVVFSRAYGRKRGFAELARVCGKQIATRRTTVTIQFIAPPLAGSYR